MLTRLVRFAVARYVGGPGKSWVFSSGILALYGFLKKKSEPKQVVDLSASKPGDKFIIEHLPITHGEQIKQFKRAAKDEAKAEKAAKASAKASRKASKQAAKAQKRAERKGRRSS